MKDKLSKEDLEARARNNNIHNHFLFLFGSMLKRCALGNYYHHKECFVFREATDLERWYCDAVYYDKYSSPLLIEAKTRLIKESQVHIEDSIKKDIFKELKDDLFNHNFIVPVLMYTREHRDTWDFKDSKIMLYFGGPNKQVWSKAHTLEEWYECLKMSYSINDLLDHASYMDNHIEPLPLALDVEQYLEDKNPEQKEPQAASDVPMINKHYKNSYIFYKYSEYVFNINDFYTLLYKSQLWKCKRGAIKSNIVRSLASHLNKDLIDLVIECDGELMAIQKECTNYKNGKHSFNSETKLFIKRCTKLIIFKKTSLALASKIVNENKDEYERFSNYMDSINPDVMGGLSDSA